MKQIRGVFDLRTGRYMDQSNGIDAYIHDECEVYVYGSVRLNQNHADAELLWKVYQEYGHGLTEQIKGIYILIIYDKTQRCLKVFHDRTTSSLTLYYAQNDHSVFLSTSLKWLLKESNIQRRLNEDVLEDFLTNGFIYGKETLLENVYKLQAFSGLELQNGQADVFSVKYPVSDMSKGEALGKWETVLPDAVSQCFENKEEINIPLSSGYDSNYIAYIASEKGNKPIHAYSVGGKFGKNELPLVEENVAAYRNIHLETALTDESTLSNLPDIVWRLEGAVYEVGIFLQYELARMVCRSGKKSLICGECADQVMNLYYLNEERISVSRKNGRPVHFEFSEYPYIFGSFLILKKNGILSNSFGIETEYPYLDEDFVSAAHALRSINEKDKRIHIALCREQLPETVVKNIAKTGGATDVHSLFACPEDMNRFISGIENSAFYQRYASIIKRTSYIEAEKQTGIKWLKTRIRNLVMDVCHLNEETRRQTAYFFEEVKLREYMCCAYLMLFEKLFISGEYDDKLDCEGIGIGVFDLI